MEWKKLTVWECPECGELIRDRDTACNHVCDKSTYAQDTAQAIKKAKDAFDLDGWIGAKIISVQPADRGHLSTADNIESIEIETTTGSRITLSSTMWDPEPSIEWD